MPAPDFTGNGPPNVAHGDTHGGTHGDTSDVTHGNTPDVTHGNTPDVTHGNTPDVTHGNTPDVTHGNTPDVTHGNTPDVTHGNTPDVTYGNTPDDIHGNTHGDTPDDTHDDDDNDGNGEATLYAGLTCVTSERAASDTVDYVQLYQPCDNVIYSMGSACGNVGPKAGLQAIAALDESKAKYVGFDYDGSQDIACYASLGRIDGWENNGYAALSVVLADDFSDVAAVMPKVMRVPGHIPITSRKRRRPLHHCNKRCLDKQVQRDQINARHSSARRHIYDRSVDSDHYRRSTDGTWKPLRGRKPCSPLHSMFTHWKRSSRWAQRPFWILQYGCHRIPHYRFYKITAA
ncbi:uncharacterized protein [Dermacentor andersoni]|uniref:uncharacterized protein n=1 Tax=Dermacentor andersoni TaxID=34620 RepID=UPI002417C193|nr:uncharacterized protein LOC129383848 [Dermacentor andersoni]